MRSMVMVRMTIGNSATDRPLTMPSLWLIRLSTAINMITTISTAARRGTSRSFKCSR